MLYTTVWASEPLYSCCSKVMSRLSFDTWGSQKLFLVVTAQSVICNIALSLFTGEAFVKSILSRYCRFFSCFYLKKSILECWLLLFLDSLCFEGLSKSVMNRFLLLLSENFAFIIFRLVFLLICSSNSFLARKFDMDNSGSTLPRLVGAFYETWLTKARGGLQPLAYANKSLIVPGLSGNLADFSWDVIELKECLWLPLIFILLTKFLILLLLSSNSKELLRIFIGSGLWVGDFRYVALFTVAFSALAASILFSFDMTFCFSASILAKTAFSRSCCSVNGFLASFSLRSSLRFLTYSL